MALIVSLCLSMTCVQAQESAAPETVEDGIAALSRGETAQASKIFWTLAGRNDAKAQYYIATMLDSGQGMGKDIHSAATFFRKSAELGYLPAMVSLGYAYSTGHGTAKNDKEAFKWYGKAANLGDAVAQNNLGMMFRDGIGTEKDLRLAMQWFWQAATQGVARAQYNLGSMYYLGQGVTADEAEALRWYTSAAEQGDMYAQSALGAIYRLGRAGVTKDPVQAQKWYLQAAENGHMVAQVILAGMYESGEGGYKSMEDAALWYLRAAKRGNPEAQYRVGLYYEKGLGLPQDLKQALVWYQKSIDEGAYVQGMGALCRLYYNGLVDIDAAKAVSTYKKGANAGDPYCQLELGRTYNDGTDTIKKDPVLAYQWFALAASALPAGEDKESAVVKRIEISNTLSERQLDDARKRVNEWKPVGLVKTRRVVRPSSR